MRRAPTHVIFFALFALVAPVAAQEEAAPVPEAPAVEDAEDDPAEAEALRLAALAVVAADEFAADRRAAEARLRAGGDAAAVAIEGVLKDLRAGRERLLLLLAEVDPARAEALRRPTDAWYLEKVAWAQARLRAGDPLGAMHHLDAILILEPDCPIRGELRAMVVRAKELLLRESILAAELAPKKRVVSGTEPVAFELQLKNVSQEEVRLSRDGGMTTVQCRLDLEIFQVDASGGIRRTRTMRRLQRGMPGTIAPGATVTIELRLQPLGEADPGIFRRIRVRGTVRPQVVIRGDDEESRFLPIFPAQVFCLHPDRQALARNPLQTLTRGLAAARVAPGAKGAEATAERVMFAALLTPSSEREQAIRALLQALEDKDDRAGPAATLALSALTELPRRDRPFWLGWAAARTR